MRRQTAGLAAAAITAAALSGCSTSAPAQSPSPRATPTAAKTLPLGAVGKLPVGDPKPAATVRITGVTAKTRVHAGGVPRGKQIATVTAKACNVGMNQPGNIDWGPFALTLNDSTLVEAATTWNDLWFTDPVFPQNRSLQRGDCVKGLVPFVVPKGAKPVRVEYQVPGGDTLLWDARQ